MIKKEDIKVGDILYVPESPQTYSSSLCGKDPVDAGIYPFTFQVEGLKQCSTWIALSGGGYGWHLEALLQIPGFKVLTDKTYELWT